MTSGLNTKTTEQNGLIALTNEKLDTIITLLGGVPPTPTATLDDLLAVLSDIHTDTMSMDGKLLTIRDSIRDASETLEDDVESLAGLLYRIRMSVATENLPTGGLQPIHIVLSEFYNYTANILGIMNVYIANLYQITSFGLANLGLNIADNSYDYQGWLANSLNLMAKIQGGIGVPIDAGNKNVIEWLAKIASRPESQIGSGLAPSEVCEDAYISSGMTLVPFGVIEGLPNITFATFPAPPPDGISFGSVFGVGVDNSELDNGSSNWSGYWLYAASSAANFALNSADISGALNRYPTNTWIELTFLETNLSVFVNGADSIRVYLCSGGWAPSTSSGGPWGGDDNIPPPDWTDCVSIASANTTVTHPNNAVSSITYTPISFLPGVEYSNELPTSGGGSYITTANDSIAVGNFNGVHIELTSASSGVRAYYQKADLSFVVHTFTGIGDTFDITEDTVRMAVDTFTGGTSEDYTVDICPPA